MSSLKKSHKYHRSAIDLPTTEPYLECTSDCDEYTESRSASAKNSFRLQLKSGTSQRLQITEKSSSSTNELVVISTTHKTDNTNANDADNNNTTTIATTTTTTTTKSISESKEKFNNVAVSELPAIKGSKRHNAWQNMKK